MAFTEAVKLEAKRRSHFRCAICQEWPVEVHHIVPQAVGGADDLENAAPLCAGCHKRFGGNPDLRKQLRETRNQWWERCAAEEAHPNVRQFEEKLDTLLIQFEEGRQQDQQLLMEVKNLVVTAVSSASTAPEIVQAVRSFATGSSSGPVTPAPWMRCSRCGEMAVVGSQCRNCGYNTDDW